MKCVCGKPIWGEGWDPDTGRYFYSHCDDNKERHSDGSWVEPKSQRDRLRGKHKKRKDEK